MRADASKLSQFLVPGSSEAYYIPNFVSEDEERYLLRKILESPQQRWKKLANRRLQLLGGTVSSKHTLIAEDMPPYVTSYPDIIGRLRDLGIFESSAHKQPNHIILNEYLPGQGIMPHEDGPSYHPVVATISLGSHSIFHYYRYANHNNHNSSDNSEETPDATSNPTSPKKTGGGAISPNPILTVFLEPRSLIITRGELYTDHLHGIDDVDKDEIALDGAGRPTVVGKSERNGVESSTEDDEGRVVANRDLVMSDDVRKMMEEGGIVDRGTRYSLTCRDVSKVTKVNVLLGKR